MQKHKRKKELKLGEDSFPPLIMARELGKIETLFAAYIAYVLPQSQLSFLFWEEVVESA